MMSPNTVPVLLKKASVCERLSLSARTLESMVNNGEFPKGERLGKFVYWTETAIQQWVVRHFGPQEAWRP
jgi:predicted DNA-binding transcriptional regulator AlpA